MKPIFIISCLLCFCFASPIDVEAQNWVSGKAFRTTNGGSTVSAVATDKYGNVFAGGDFHGQHITVPPATLYGSPSDNRLIITKYDSSGNQLWAKSSSAGHAWIMSMACDQGGNLLVYGMTYFTPAFNIQGHVLPDSADQYFLAKFDSSGNVLWIKNPVQFFNPVVPQISGCMAVDDADNIYITGGIIDSITNVEGHLLYNQGGADIFIIKYDPSGNIIWARSEGGAKDDLSWSIAVTHSGNFYIGGTFVSDSIIVDSSKVYFGRNLALTGAMFVFKHDSSGNVIWAYATTGTGLATSVATDEGENAYLTGFYNFINPDSSFQGGRFIVFLEKLDPSGDMEWIRKIEGGRGHMMNSIAVDACNNIWLIGTLDTTVTFDSSVVLGHPANSFIPLFMAEYSPSGHLLETASLQSSVYTTGITADQNRNIYVGGAFNLNIPWSGSIPFIMGADSIYTTNDANDGYIAKYKPATMLKDSAYMLTDTFFCVLNHNLLCAPAGYAAYRWSDNTWGATHIVTDTTSFYVYCYPATCAIPTLIDTFSVEIDTPSVFSLGNDTLSCLPFAIRAPYTTGTYLWQDGSTADSFYASVTGTYILTETERVCSFTDTITVVIDSTPCIPSMMLMPTAFTPNSDGVNDVLRPMAEHNSPISEYTYSIYSRTGTLLFTTNNPGEGWDGTYSNRKAEMGVFIYQIKYTSDGKKYHLGGNITLVK